MVKCLKIFLLKYFLNSYFGPKCNGHLHLIIVTEDSSHNEDGDIVTGDSMNGSVYIYKVKRKVNFSLTLDIKQ